MQKRKSNRCAMLSTVGIGSRGLVVAASALALWPGAGALGANPIQVNVNGNPVSFTGAPPVEVDGSVLVPLRGVFEAMGATVNYDSAARTITAKEGSQIVVLAIGSTSASIDGNLQTLSQPARVEDGTTLVPLRFVAQALGGYVQWQAAQNTVAITTPEAHLSQLPTAPGSGTVIGMLTGIYNDTNPQQITVRVNGANTTIPITSNTTFVRSLPGTAGVAVAFGDVRVGDQVTVHRDPEGNATTVAAIYGELRGTIKSVEPLANGGDLVTLNDGSTATLVPDAILRMNGRKIQISDIMPDERVVIRTNPTDNQGYELLLNPQGNPAAAVADATGQSVPQPAADDNTGEGVPQAAGPLVTSFNIDANKPLRAGDTFTATLKGTPGGTAELCIPGVAQNVSMVETTPGVYTAQFSVPSGVAVDNGLVLARITVLNHTSALIQAAQKVTIDAIAPQVSVVFPARDSTVEASSPLIYAALTNTGGIGIDPKQTQIWVDGQNVTANAAVTGASIDFEPSAPLAPGEHHVKVTVVDSLGNQSTTEWPFTVSEHRAIELFQTSAQPGQILNAGSDIHFTLQGPADAHASVAILGISRDIPLHQDQPGLYKGVYTVQPGDNTSEAPVVARVKTGDGHEFTTILSTGVTVAAGSPASPVITTPIDGASINGTVDIAGIAPPLSTVRLTVGYDTKAAGNLINLDGTEAVREATADASGNWSIANVPVGGNTLFATDQTQYTIKAETLDPNGQRSAEADITVQGGHVYAHRRGQD